jgi:hypothetical protein
MVALVVTMTLMIGPAQTSAPAPVTIDRIVARVGEDIVQSLDVRQARLLRLFGPTVSTDTDVLDHLIVRRLQLADVSHYPAAEPTTEDLAARRAAWVATLEVHDAAAVASQLKDAGMSEAELTAWFRDDARIEEVERQRFAGAPATHDEVVAYIRAHAAGFASPDGKPADVEDPGAQAKARREIGATRLAAGVAAWVDSLRKRAVIIR